MREFGETLNNEPKCAQCGAILTPKNALPAPDGWCSNLGYTYFCLDCQQKYFDMLIGENFSPRRACFFCCAAFNVPFVESSSPTDKATNAWISYLKTIAERGEDTLEDGTRARFIDGATEAQGDGQLQQAGTALQRRVWGLGPTDKPYTNREFDALDSYYNAYVGRLEKGGGPDEQQEYTLRLCARCMVEIDRAMEIGKPEVVQRYNKIIQDNLAAENLRKKDAKPLEDLRIDSIVDALEKKGYMVGGELLGYDELIEKLRGDVPHYRYTRDAADQMLLAIVNTMRANEGYSEYTELPIGYRIVDTNGEFAETPNAKEVAAYNQLGLIREGVGPTMIKRKPARTKRKKTKIQPKEVSKKEPDNTKEE